MKQISLSNVGSGLSSSVEMMGSDKLREAIRDNDFFHQVTLGIFLLWLELYQITKIALLMLLSFYFEFVY